MVLNGMHKGGWLELPPFRGAPVAAAFAGACTLAARGQAYVLMGGDGAFVMSWPQCQLTMFMQDDDPDGVSKSHVNPKPQTK